MPRITQNTMTKSFESENIVCSFGTILEWEYIEETAFCFQMFLMVEWMKYSLLSMKGIAIIWELIFFLLLFLNQKE